MKHVGLLLHFYQPPTQDPEIVKKIDEECYLPIFEMLEETSAEVTLNINYSLTEQLAELAPKTLEAVSRLEKCCFSSSGAYHPIFPLIPPCEVMRQIRLNDQGNRALIGSVYRPSGVFPPEMAVDGHTARLVADMGYRWMISDDVPWVSHGREVPWNTVPWASGTAVLMRSNYWSNRISFHGGRGDEIARELLLSLNEWTGKEDSYLIIAMDGETFGHHLKGAIESFLRPFLKEMNSLQGIRVSSLDRIAGLFPGIETEIPAGSWSTTAADIADGEPFPLWSNSGNINHRKYKELLDFVLKQSRKNATEGVADKTDKMLYSCPLWWASPGRECYSQVRRGILLIIDAALKGITQRELLDRVMELAGEIPAMAGKDR
jgi:hypothetical protein